MERLRNTLLYQFLSALVSRELSWLRRMERWLVRRRLKRSYRRWLAAKEPALGARYALENHASSAPHFVICQYMPETDEQTLLLTIENLRNQAYPHWQMHLVLGKMPAGHGAASAPGLQRDDHRVRFWSPHDFALACRQMADRVQGNHVYWVLLPANCALHPAALQRFAYEIGASGECDWIYSDEDRLTRKGNRHTPWFKPAWSPELLFSVPYLVPAVIRHQLLDAARASWFNPGTGIQWQVLLSLLELTAQPSVLHVPEILCHRVSERGGWCVGEVLTDDEKIGHRNWAHDHLVRRGLGSVTVEAINAHGLRVRWDPGSPLVSIIVPTRDKPTLLKSCLGSLLGGTNYGRFEICIIDTGSTDLHTWEYYRELRGHPQIKLYARPGRFNYSAVNNFGARNASGELLLFMNNDVRILHADWLSELVSWACLPEVGIVGPKLLFPDGTIQHAGVIVGLGGHAGHVFLGAKEGECGPFGSVEWYRNYSAVTGACMMMRREVYEALGGFDETYQLVFSDVDICLRAIEKGYRVMYTPFARLLHYGGKTRGRFNPRPDLWRAYQAFSSLLQQGDPYYNPNLSYARTYPRLRGAKEAAPIEALRRLFPMADS